MRKRILALTVLALNVSASESALVDEYKKIGLLHQKKQETEEK
jgi:hypothetical protein